MHAIDKHEKKIIYSCENIQSKGPRKIIWLFLGFKPFFEMDPSGTTQGWVHLLARPTFVV